MGSPITASRAGGVSAVPWTGQLARASNGNTAGGTEFTERVKLGLLRETGLYIGNRQVVVPIGFKYQQ
jgi:hypothetical protein